MPQPIFKVTGKLEVFEGKAAWVYLPIDFADVPPVFPGGWGSIPIEVTLGHSTWKTSMFPLRKQGYFIPVKQLILKSENLNVGDKVTVKYRAL